MFGHEKYLSNPQKNLTILSRNNSCTFVSILNCLHGHCIISLCKQGYDYLEHNNTIRPV